MRSLVSIIVPVYNVEKYLRRCLDSILSQEYKDIEIIIVDDGSSDGSSTIVDEYAKKKNIKVIHKQNGGLSSARNKGLEHATGEWCAFVDSDDYIDKKYISRMIEIADVEGADIVTCSFSSFSDDGSKLKKSPNWPAESLGGKEAIEDMFKNKRPAYIWLNLFRTNLFKKNIRFPEGKNYEDIATKIKLMYYANKVAYTDEKLYYYLSRKGSITNADFSQKKHDDYCDAIDDVRAFLEEKKCCLKYLDYFSCYSYITQLNYLAMEKKPYAKESMDYWRRLHICALRNAKKCIYPTNKVRAFYMMIVHIARCRALYSIMYRGYKK